MVMIMAFVAVAMISMSVAMIVMVVIVAMVMIVLVFFPMIVSMVIVVVIMGVLAARAVRVTVDGGIVMVRVDRRVLPLPHGDFDPLDRFDVCAGVLPLGNDKANRSPFRGRERSAVSLVNQDPPLEDLAEGKACGKPAVL